MIVLTELIFLQRYFSRQLSWNRIERMVLRFAVCHWHSIYFGSRRNRLFVHQFHSGRKPTTSNHSIVTFNASIFRVKQAAVACRNSSFQSIWSSASSSASYQSYRKFKKLCPIPVYYKVLSSHCTPSIWPGRLWQTIRIAIVILASWASSRETKRIRWKRLFLVHSEECSSTTTNAISHFCRLHSTHQVLLDWWFGFCAFCTVRCDRRLELPEFLMWRNKVHWTFFFCCSCISYVPFIPKPVGKFWFFFENGRLVHLLLLCCVASCLCSMTNQFRYLDLISFICTHIVVAKCRKTLPIYEKIHLSFLELSCVYAALSFDLWAPFFCDLRLLHVFIAFIRQLAIQEAFSVVVNITIAGRHTSMIV